jgi:hypothetical protein
MISDKFSHLTESELNSLITEYYCGSKIADLIIQYRLKIKANELVKNLPPEETNNICKFCELKLIRNRISRDRLSWGNSTEYCLQCGHEENSFCSCTNCKELENLRTHKLQVQKQNFIEKYVIDDEDDRVDFNSLTFEEKIYLGALLREGISEDYNYIKPLEQFINPLAPTNDMRSEILNLLIDKNIIIIHPSTDSEFIEIIDYENGKYRYYPFKVKWLINIERDDLNKVHLIDSIINPTQLLQENFEEAFIIWKKIALNECLQYFEHSINNILGIEYNIGTKTINVFNDLLNNYSVSQIYGIIYKSTNSALRFQAERGCSRQHSANTIIGSAQSYAERAKINNWEILKYSRIKECGESALSKFLFERVVKIGYSGFNDCPNISLVK